MGCDFGGATQILAIAGIVSVQAVFAGYQLLGHAVLTSGLNPIAFSLLRELSASVVFILAALAFVPRSGWPRAKHICRFAFCGLSMFGNVFLNLLALTVTTGSMVALLQPTQPVFASMLAAFLGHEQMTWKKLLGMILCIIGGFLESMSQHGHKGGINVGVLLILGQCLSGANYVVQQRPLIRAGYSPLIVSSCSYVLASVFTVLVGGIYFALMSPEERAHVEWWDSSASFVGVLVYCVLMTTVYNYIVIAWVTGRLGATVVTLFTLMQGVFACAAEYVCFGAPILLNQAIGCLAVFAGLVVVVGAAGSTSLAYVDTRAEWVQALSGVSSFPHVGAADELGEAERPHRQTRLPCANTGSDDLLKNERTDTFAISS